METLIAIGSINSFFFALIVFGKRSRSKADNLLATLFIVLGLSFGTVYLSYLINQPGLQIFMWNISLLIAPLLYLYAYALINSRIKSPTQVIINFVPYVLSSVYINWVCITGTDMEIQALFNSKLQDTSLQFMFFTMIETLVIPLYIILIFRLLKKHNKNIKLFFSNLTDHNLRWLRVLIIGILLIWLIVNILYYGSNISKEMSPKYGFGFASFFIFYLGYFATKQKPVYDNETENKPEDRKYLKSEIKNGEIESLNNKLLELLEIEKPYLDPDITLVNLADTLKNSTHNLSQLINSKFEMNFFELINKYRIDEFEKKIRNGDSDKYTLISIAYDCGFNSKSTFNRVFKNITGQTPTSFVKDFEN